jgi:hypothetical protein
MNLVPKPKQIFDEVVAVLAARSGYQGGFQVD